MEEKSKKGDKRYEKEKVHADVLSKSIIQAVDEHKKEGIDQESIQSSTTPDPGYQWESDNVTIDITNESKEVSPFPASDHMASTKRCA